MLQIANIYFSKSFLYFLTWSLGSRHQQVSLPFMVHGQKAPWHIHMSSEWALSSIHWCCTQDWAYSLAFKCSYYDVDPKGGIPGKCGRKGRFKGLSLVHYHHVWNCSHVLSCPAAKGCPLPKFYNWGSRLSFYKHWAVELGSKPVPSRFPAASVLPYNSPSFWVLAFHGDNTRMSLPTIFLCRKIGDMFL